MINRRRVVFGPTSSLGLLLLFVSCLSASAFGQEPANGPLVGTTAAHNTIRQNLNNGVAPVPNSVAQPVACPALPDFVWDNAVAATAQAWADGCSLSHEQGSGFGENLQIGGPPGNLTGPGAAVAWADEVWEGNANYNYNAHSCNPAGEFFPLSNCGHYTQVAWAGTTALGCGYAICGGSEWIVCRYNPAGNVNIATTRPYCTATQTTGCEPGPGVCGGVNACTGAIDLVCGVPLNGTTVGATADFNGYNCAGGDQAGTDVVLKFVSPQAGPVTLDLTPNASDLDLFVLGGCDTNNCSGASENGPGPVAEQVIFTAVAGQIYDVIVEDFNSAGDTFTLTAACPPGNQDQLLTVAKNGTGTGGVTSNPAGINCGSDCTENYLDNTQVTLTATAGVGSSFFGWDGDCLFAGANPTCTVMMNAAKNVTATFNIDVVNACIGAIDLVCGVPLNDTTVGATADFNGYNCSANDQAGTDVVLKFVSPQAGPVTLDLTPNASDLDLFVLGGCDTNNCSGASENGPGPVAEQVIFTAVAGQIYDVIVEDYNSAGDTFTLMATCPPGGGEVILTDGFEDPAL